MVFCAEYSIHSLPGSATTKAAQRRESLRERLMDGVGGVWIESRIRDEPSGNLGLATHIEVEQDLP